MLVCALDRSKRGGDGKNSTGCGIGGSDGRPLGARLSDGLGCGRWRFLCSCGNFAWSIDHVAWPAAEDDQDLLILFLVVLVLSVVFAVAGAVIGKRDQRAEREREQREHGLGWNRPG
jgi:hypothetical protein